MNDDITRDPKFREQFAGGIKPDAEFEAALAGCVSQPAMRPVSQPLAPSIPWQQPQFVRLK